MIEPTVVFRETDTAGLASTSSAPDRPGVYMLLFLSAWSGLVAGLLEVGTITLRKQMVDPDHLYKMSRHFVWLVPLTNAGIFLALGLLGWGLILFWPHRGRWLFAACAWRHSSFCRRSWWPFPGSTAWRGCS